MISFGVLTQNNVILMTESQNPGPPFEIFGDTLLLVSALPHPSELHLFRTTRCCLTIPSELHLFSTTRCCLTIPLPNVRVSFPFY